MRTHQDSSTSADVDPAAAMDARHAAAARRWRAEHHGSGCTCAAWTAPAAPDWGDGAPLIDPGVKNGPDQGSV